MLFEFIKLLFRNKKRASCPSETRLLSDFLPR